MYTAVQGVQTIDMLLRDLYGEKLMTATVLDGFYWLDLSFTFLGS